MSQSIRDRMVERLSAAQGEVPTSRLARLGKVVATVARSGRLALGERLKRDAARGQLDFEVLARLVGSLGELKGVSMKVGQLLSYVDVALPESAREGLGALQTHGRPLPFAAVERILRGELRASAGDVLGGLEETPVAAASIGQVHRGVLADGSTVAVKVQYPGIERAIERDFGPAAVGRSIASIVYPGAKVAAFIDEARRRFLEECDYSREARTQERFAQLYTDHDTLLIPAVHPELSSRRVLTMSYMKGDHLDAFLARNPSQAQRDRVGRALFEVYIGALFRHGVYHCDPHPGNYLVREDGRVAVLDFGCARQFEPDMVTRLGDLTTAVHEDDQALLHRALVDLGALGPSASYDRAAARRLVRGFFGPMLHDEERTFTTDDVHGMREVVQRKSALLRLDLPGEFLFLLRVRFGLAAVLARIGARANWRRLEGDVVAAHRARVEEAHNPHTFAVVIKGAAGEQAIGVIRELRDALGVTLEAARKLVEVTPHTVDHAFTRGEADGLRERIAAAGGSADVVPFESAPATASEIGDDSIDALERRRKRARRRRG